MDLTEDEQFLEYCKNSTDEELRIIFKDNLIKARDNPDTEIGKKAEKLSSFARDELIRRGKA